MKKLILVLAALATVFSTASAPVDAGESYVYEEFEDGVAGVFDSLYGLTDSIAGHEGNGIYTHFGTGDVWGSRSFWYFDQHGFEPPTELYWRYWVRFDPNFYITVPKRGKIPGPATLGNDGCNGGDPTTISNPCFSARTMFSRDYKGDALPGETLLGYYNYSLDSPSHRGDLWDWDPEVALLEFGEWYCVEGHIDLGSPGGSNGVLEAWVDGEPAFSNTNIRYRRAAETFGIESFWFDIYYGNPSTPSPKEQGIWFDSWAMGSTRQGCNDAAVWNGLFRDDDDSVFEGDIEWLANAGITAGCNPPANDRFCPDAQLTRGQMAAFLDRALDLPDTDIDFFPDDNGSQFEQSINRLAAADITRGCHGGISFCADSRVSREQMAAFLHRALEGTVALGEFNHFTDSQDSTFIKDIEWLSAAEVTQGCNPPANSLFCPKSYVTRGQMAAFLKRALSD